MRLPVHKLHAAERHPLRLQAQNATEYGFTQHGKHKEALQAAMVQVRARAHCIRQLARRCGHTRALTPWYV